MRAKHLISTKNTQWRQSLSKTRITAYCGATSEDDGMAWSFYFYPAHCNCVACLEEYGLELLSRDETSSEDD